MLATKRVVGAFVLSRAAAHRSRVLRRVQRGQAGLPVRTFSAASQPLAQYAPPGSTGPRKPYDASLKRENVVGTLEEIGLVEDAEETDSRYGELLDRITGTQYPHVPTMMRIWRAWIMDPNGKPGIKEFNQVLEARSRMGKSNIPMLLEGQSLSLDSLDLLVRGCVKVRSLPETMSALTAVCDSGLLSAVECHDLFLRAYSQVGDITGCLLVFDEMQSRELAVTPDHHMSVACAFAAQGTLKGALSVIEEIKDVMTPTMWTQLLRTLMSKDHPLVVLELYEQLLEAGVEHTTTGIAQMMEALERLGHHDRALECFLDIRFTPAGRSLPIRVYAHLLKELQTGGQFDRALELVRKDIAGYKEALVAGDAAHAMYAWLGSPAVESVLAGLRRAGRRKEAIELFAAMREIGGNIAPRRATFNVMVLVFEESAPGRSDRDDCKALGGVLQHMAAVEVTPETLVYDAVMKVIASRGWLVEPDRTGGELTRLIELLESEEWRAVGVLSEAKSVAVQTHARALYARARDATIASNSKDPAAMLHHALGLIPGNIPLKDLLVPLLRVALRKAKAPGPKVVADVAAAAELETKEEEEEEVKEKKESTLSQAETAVAAEAAAHRLAVLEGIFQALESRLLLDVVEPERRTSIWTSVQLAVLQADSGEDASLMALDRARNDNVYPCDDVIRRLALQDLKAWRSGRAMHDVTLHTVLLPGLEYLLNIRGGEENQRLFHTLNDRWGKNPDKVPEEPETLLNIINPKWDWQHATSLPDTYNLNQCIQYVRETQNGERAAELGMALFVVARQPSSRGVPNAETLVRLFSILPGYVRRPSMFMVCLNELCGAMQGLDLSIHNERIWVRLVRATQASPLRVRQAIARHMDVCNVSHSEYLYRFVAQAFVHSSTVTDRERTLRRFASDVPPPGIYSKQLIQDLLGLAKRQQSSELLWAVWDAWALADNGKLAPLESVQSVLLEALRGKHDDAVANGRRFTEEVLRSSRDGKLNVSIVTTLVHELVANLARKRNLLKTGEATPGWAGQESPQEFGDYFVVLAKASSLSKKAQHPQQRLRLSLVRYAADTLSPVETFRLLRAVDRSYGIPLLPMERQGLLQQLLARFTKLDLLQGLTEGMTSEAEGWQEWSNDLIALEVQKRESPTEDPDAVSSSVPTNLDEQAPDKNTRDFKMDTRSAEELIEGGVSAPES